MDLKALKRIILARWWILVAAVIIALVVSARLDEYRTSEVPEAEAITWVTFIEDPAALERDEFESLLETQVALARTVNSDVINQTPGPFLPWRIAEVDVEFDQNQIQFIGRGENEQAAIDIASEMRQRFLAASSIGAGRDRINAELDELTEQIGNLRAQVAAAQAPDPLTAEEMEIESRRATLTGQISSLRGHLAALSVERISPVAPRTVAQVDAEMARTQQEIDALEMELEALPTLEEPVDEAADLELLLTQLQLQNLEQRWETLYQSERALAALATEGDVVTQPVTVDVPSGATNTAIAVFAAVFVVGAVLVIFERARRIAWTTTDLDLEPQPPVFTEVAPRSLDIFERPSGNLWYLSAPRGRRKGSVQYLRSALEDYQDAVVGIQGTGVNQIDIHELAGDIAISTAVSRRKVLLLDTAFNERNRLPEYGSDENPTVADLLLADVWGAAAKSHFKAAISKQEEVSHGLIAFRAGDIDSDAADVLSTTHFETLLRVAREEFDIVIVVGSEVDDPASHVVSKRVDTVVLLGAIGHTVSDNVETATRDLAVRNVPLLGVVMVVKRRNAIQRWAAGIFRRATWGFIDWVRGLREGKPVTKSGFEQNLDRFGVSDTANLSESRYADVEGEQYAEAVERPSPDEVAS